MIQCPSLGELTKLKIGHNNKGPGSGWFLGKIIVDDTLMNRVYEFVCERWLAEDEGSFSLCSIPIVLSVNNLFKFFLR
jgi:hypothetical protein